LDGDYARLIINGTDYSPNQKGINILVIDPQTLDAYIGAFDTHAHVGNESHHLTKFLASVPATHVLILAVRADASRRLHYQARLALQERGVDFPSPDNAEMLLDSIDSKAFNRNKAAELLLFAAIVNAPKCAKILIDHGWDINYQRKHGSQNTALLDATFHGSVETLELLLEHGANRSITNKWSETAEDIATKLFGFASVEAMIIANREMQLQPVGADEDDHHQYQVNEMQHEEENL